MIIFLSSAVTASEWIGPVPAFTNSSTVTEGTKEKHNLEYNHKIYAPENEPTNGLSGLLIVLSP